MKSFQVQSIVFSCIYVQRNSLMTKQSRTVKDDFLLMEPCPKKQSKKKKKKTAKRIYKKNFWLTLLISPQRKSSPHGLLHCMCYLLAFLCRFCHVFIYIVCAWADVSNSWHCTTSAESPLYAPSSKPKSVLIGSVRSDHTRPALNSTGTHSIDHTVVRES